MELRLPSTSGLFAPKSELRDARSATIIGLHALALLLFSWKPLVAGALLAVGLALSGALVRPNIVAILALGFLVINDPLVHFFPSTQLTAWKDVLLLLLVSTWLAQSVMYRSPLLLKSEIAYPFAIVFLLFFVMSVASPTPVHAALGLKNTAFYMTWFLVLPYALRTKNDVRNLVTALIVGGACLGAYNLWLVQQPIGYFQPDRLGRILPGALIAHWSGSGYVIPPALMLGFALLPVVHRKLRHWLLLSLFLMAIGLIATLGRAHWVTTIFALTAMGAISGRLKQVLLILMAFIAIAPFISVNYNRMSVADRATSFTDEQDVSKNARENETKSVMLPFILTHPFGIGTGTMTSQGAGKVWAGEKIAGSVNAGSIHNNFILIAIEIGWLGLLASIWVNFAFGFMCHRIYRTARDGFVKAVALGLFGFSITLFLMQFFSPMTIQVLISYEIWALIGLVTVLPHIDDPLVQTHGSINASQP